jgi:glycosyltransferase involved in cell wall biosynthesis
MKRNTKYRIGILHNAYLQKGGEDQVVENEIKLLKENNFIVSLLKFQNSDNQAGQISSFIFSCFNVLSFLRCIKWLKANKINVLHIHNWFYKASPSVIWAARFCKVPVVMTVHNYRLICPSANLTNNNALFTSSLDTEFPWEAVKKGVYRNSSVLTFIAAFNVWINNKIGTWNVISRFIILTQHSKEVIQKSRLYIDPAKFMIKPNFIFPPSALGAQSRENHYLFVGRLSEDKGINLLLGAFTETSYKVKIIGTGPLQNKVEEFSKNNSNVTYLGFQEKDVIQKEMLRCNALIFPSCETFGMVIIEAFSMSTPVIASCLGGASMIVKNEFNGLHIEDSSISELKNKLEKWTSLEKSIKEKYCQNAYDSYLNLYSPEKNLEQLIDVYKSVINN